MVLECEYDVKSRLMTGYLLMQELLSWVNISKKCHKQAKSLALCGKMINFALKERKTILGEAAQQD